MNVQPNTPEDDVSDVVGLGAVVVDEQFFVERIPAEDEKEKATSVRSQIGGPVPTALVTLRRFGAQCHFIGPWGDDAFGTMVEEDLWDEGVSWSSRCRCSSESTGRAHVWTSTANGSRTIVSHHSGWDALHLSEADEDALRRCSFLHLDGTGGKTAVAAAELVRQAGGRVFMDCGSPKSATKELLPLCHAVSFPTRFVKQFFGSDDPTAAMQTVNDLGPDIVICTDGSNGASVLHEGSITHVPAFEVSTVDSTGAGDVFCAGVLSCLLKGDDPVEAVRFGAAAAALKCRTVGNRDALPTSLQISELLTGDASQS